MSFWVRIHAHKKRDSSQTSILIFISGNTEDQDPDRPAPAPVKVADKPVQRTGKRNAGPEPASDPLRSSGGRGGRDGA